MRFEKERIPTMKRLVTVLGLLLLLPALFSGCASRTRYVETGGSENIVTVGEINIQDYIRAAEDSVNKLLASGALDRVPEPPAILAISRVVNNTSQHIDTDLLTKRIRVQLLESGKALTSTTVGLDGAEDELADRLQAQHELATGKPAVRPPDFSLSGKIIQTQVSAGRKKQSTFSFQLTLSNNQGLGVWEGLEDITKQGSRASVGF